MKIVLPEPHAILTPLKWADLLAAQEGSSNATPWWLKILKAVGEGTLPCCYESGEPVGKSDVCGKRDIRDPHLRAKDLGAWLSELGYSVIHKLSSNGGTPDLSPAM